MNDVSHSHEPAALSDDLLGRVTERLGIPTNLTADIDGLRTVYRGWCSNIPFDNMRKMVSLRTGGELAGLDAEDFFENFLANGTGGTCWPSSNALYVLVRDLGFDARRAAGSMFEVPDVNHGTVKVRFGDEDWMVDSSMLTYEPFPVTSEIYITKGTHPVETEVYDDSHVVWVDFPPMPEFIPCRMRLDPVDSNFYTERYEVFSRTQSPFNDKLYFRKGGADGTTVVFGHTRFRRNGDDLEVEDFDRDGLRDYLVNTAGVSQKLVDEWTASGALEATFAETERPASPPLDRARPSRR